MRAFDNKTSDMQGQAYDFGERHGVIDKRKFS